MSDYGFATYDEKTGKKKEGSVNSKWPIFGPRYDQIKRAFKTIHFTDTKSYSIRSASLSLPPQNEDGAKTEYHGYEKVLIATIPHGYKKRPMGYATITGSFNKNTRGRWEYVRQFDNWGLWPASTTLNSTRSESGMMQTNVGYGLRPLETTSARDAFYDNIFQNCGMTYPNDLYGEPMEGMYIADGYFYVPGNNSSTPDDGSKPRYPYTVEIDATNIYVYRWYYWCDVWTRIYVSDGFDIRGRFKGIIDYAGSSFDMTIYLAPYSMEDLV